MIDGGVWISLTYKIDVAYFKNITTEQENGKATPGIEY